MNTVLLVLGVVLAVVGAGLSYSGYIESQSIQTVTSAQPYTVTSTLVVSSTITQTRVITTSDVLSILDEVIHLQGIKGTRYAGYYDSVSSRLDVGKVNVSFSSEGGPVDFWMLREDQFKAYVARRVVEPGVYSVMEKQRSSSYEGTANIQTSGNYYFVFQNRNDGPVSVTLHVDGGMQSSVLAKTEEQTHYSTLVSPFVTESVSFNTKPVGFGLLFYSGIGMIALGAILLAYTRMKGAGPGRAQPSAAAPVAPALAPPVVPTAGKFCMNCGVPLPANATFCTKCGAKQ